MFRSPQGHTHLFQIVFSKGNAARDAYPMSRAHLYAAGDGGGELAAARALHGHDRRGAE